MATKVRTVRRGGVSLRRTPGKLPGSWPRTIFHLGWSLCGCSHHNASLLHINVCVVYFTILQKFKNFPHITISTCTQRETNFCDPRDMWPLNMSIRNCEPPEKRCPVWGWMEEMVKEASPEGLPEAALDRKALAGQGSGRGREYSCKKYAVGKIASSSMKPMDRVREWEGSREWCRRTRHHHHHLQSTSSQMV